MAVKAEDILPGRQNAFWFFNSAQIFSLVQDQYKRWRVVFSGKTERIYQPLNAQRKPAECGYKPICFHNYFGTKTVTFVGPPQLNKKRMRVLAPPGSMQLSQYQYQYRTVPYRIIQAIFSSFSKTYFRTHLSKWSQSRTLGYLRTK